MKDATWALRYAAGAGGAKNLGLDFLDRAIQVGCQLRALRDELIAAMHEVDDQLEYRVRGWPYLPAP